MIQNYPDAINNPSLTGAERLAALKAHEDAGGRAKKPDRAGGTEINNHIHTIYSFSPYSPSAAALLARDAGLAAAGSVDHDSIAAAGEMLAACEILGIGGCVGAELRVSMAGSGGQASAFASRKINNPDSAGLAYMTVQGVPKQHVKKMADFLAPIRGQRLKRSRAMTVSANVFLREAGLAQIDFDADIVARSKYAEGGGVTDRHILAAMAEKLIDKFGKGAQMPDALKAKFNIAAPAKLAALLCDTENPHYLYDLLGLLKSEFLPRIFIQPGEMECIPAEKLAAFAQSVNAIAAYPYLGDVGQSPTGDKKAEKFEDEYIEELFAEVSRLGLRAITYMPPRNTPEQLRNIRKLAAQWGFMEISGVDINSSRQSFNCPEVLSDECRHLIDTTWALIAHERLASADERHALFSAENPLAAMPLSERIACYAKFGKRLDLRRPDESAAQIALEIEKGDIT
ncbi:MAG: PHP domain-containing protein [Spirochaetes bacterium]|nr:PHP domain-containing protein [Spirochaetota bacterium]